MKQKQVVNILIFIVVIGIIFITIYFNNNSIDPITPKTNLSSFNEKVSINSTTNYQTKTNTEGAVTVGVSPKQLIAGNGEVAFKVVLSTHSVNLDQPFTKIMILEDNLGNIYQATKWTGGSGGHHLTGDIIFPEIKTNAKKVMLRVNKIDGINRVFVWDI